MKNLLISLKTYQVCLLYTSIVETWNKFFLLQEYLEKFDHMFDINMARSMRKLCEDHTLNDYQMHHVDITSKGGGVAIYTTNKLTCKVLQPMSTTIDNVLECLRVELCLANQKIWLLVRDIGNSVRV